MSVLYKVDNRKRTFAEHWRLHRPNLPGFLVAAVCKLLGVTQPCTFGIRRPTVLNRHEPDELPRLVRERLTDTVRACTDLGLAFQFYGSVEATVGTRVKAYTAALLHAEGLFWATGIAVLVRGGGAERVPSVKFTCFSRLADGRYIVTSDHVWKLTPHPGDLVVFVSGAPPAAVAERHARRIESPEMRPLTVRADELANVILEREQRHVDYQVIRGVYVPMTAAEVDRVAGHLR
jgi:hypothetical protein